MPTGNSSLILALSSYSQQQVQCVLTGEILEIRLKTAFSRTVFFKTISNIRNKKRSSSCCYWITSLIHTPLPL